MHARLRASFTVFHLTLGIVVLIESLRTAVAALAKDSALPHVHLGVLASVEAAGALLFLLPRGTRLGGALLLGTFAIAMLVHLHLHLGFPTPLLVYAAGTAFVMVHGSAWGAGGVPLPTTAHRS